MIGLRFTHDPFCFEARFETLRRELGDGFIAVELDSSAGNPHGHPKNAHSVLTEHLDDRQGTPTRAALDQVLDFFRRAVGADLSRGPDAPMAEAVRPPPSASVGRTVSPVEAGYDVDTRFLGGVEVGPGVLRDRARSHIGHLDRTSRGAADPASRGRDGRRARCC